MLHTLIQPEFIEILIHVLAISHYNLYHRNLYNHFINILLTE